MEGDGKFVSCRSSHPHLRFRDPGNFVQARVSRVSRRFPPGSDFNLVAIQVHRLRKKLSHPSTQGLDDLA